MSRPFTAKFSSLCAQCDGQIVAGHRVEFIDDDLCHVKCPDPAPVCPTCFLVLPASGVCEECIDGQGALL